MVVIREYLDSRGASPFGKWIDGLHAPAAAKVAVALIRVEQGNFSNVKSVGGGVYECKIDFGPGYRVYFGRDGEVLVILLGGGTKKRQSADIAAAKERWKDFRDRKGKQTWR